MSVQIEQVSSFERKLSFSVPAGAVAKELDSALRNLRQHAVLRGFRKGKVPVNILEQRYGRQVRAEVAATLINNNFKDAASELEFFGQPSVEKGDLKRGQAFDFSIVVQVKPELALASYTGLQVPYSPASVPDDQVEAAVQGRLASKMALAEVDEPREILATDMVLAELEITDGDESVHSHPGTMINLQDDTYYTGIDAVLVGKKSNSKKLGGEVTFAEGALEELAGKTLTVKAKVLSLQEMRTPDLNDELAEELGFEGGAEGMRAALHGQLLERAEELSRNQARAKLLQQLIDANAFDVPSALIEQQLNLLQEQLRIQAAYSGQDPRNVRFTDEDMVRMRGQATFAAKGALILEHVSDKESLTVTDGDLEARYQSLADQRGQTVELIKSYFQKEEAVDELRARLLEEKTLDWLLENSDLVEESAEAEAAPAEAAEAKPKKKSPAKKKTTAKKKKAEETEADEG